MGQLRGSRLEPGDPGDSQPNAGSRRRVLPGLRRVSGHSANNNQPRRRSPGRVLGPVGGHKSEFWTTPPRRDLCNRRRSQFDDFASPGNIIAVPRTRGYRIVTAYGEIIPRGRPDVSTLCGGRLSNCTGYPANPPYSQPIVGVAATPSGAGLWALDRHGKVWAAGDGVWHGDAQHQGIPTGIAATPSGKGYYIVEFERGRLQFWRCRVLRLDRRQWVRYYWHRPEYRREREGQRLLAGRQRWWDNYVWTSALLGVHRRQ